MPTINDDEVVNCPKCSKRMKQRSAKRYEGGWLYELYCETTVCPWYNTGRAVETDSRGNVFERDRGERGMDKSFPAMSPDALAKGRRKAEEAAGRNLEDE